MKTKATNYLYNLYIEENDDEPAPINVPVKGGILSVGKNTVILPGVSTKTDSLIKIGSNSFIGYCVCVSSEESYPRNSIISGDQIVASSRQKRPSIMLAGDDFGRTHLNNVYTLQAFSKGYLHHASLMVNRGEGTVEALEMISGTPWINQVGLHFNMTEGIPLSPLAKESWYSVNEKGNFGMTIIGKRTAFFLTPKEKRLIRSELRAQIEKYKSLGFKPAYFDSHGNIHFKKPVARIILKTLIEEGFQYVRIPRYEKANHPLYDFFFKRPVIRMYRKHFQTADKFMNATDIFNSVMLEPSDAIYEVMVHPWENDGHLTNRRDVEFNVIEAFCKSAKIKILK